MSVAAWNRAFIAFSDAILLIISMIFSAYQSFTKYPPNMQNMRTNDRFSLGA